MMCRKVQFMIVVNYTFFIFANHYKCVNKKNIQKRCKCFIYDPE